DMYGKIMAISDELMWRYWELLTDVSLAGIQTMKKQASSGKNPMEFKKGLATKIVADFHSEDAAKQAGEDWAKQFQRDEVPENIESIQIDTETVKYSGVKVDPATINEPETHIFVPD